MVIVRKILSRGSTRRSKRSSLKELAERSILDKGRTCRHHGELYLSIETSHFDESAPPLTPPWFFCMLSSKIKTSLAGSLHSKTNVPMLSSRTVVFFCHTRVISQVFSIVRIVLARTYKVPNPSLNGDTSIQDHPRVEKKNSEEQRSTARSTAKHSEA